jgi:hypothetical protein
MTTYHFEVPPFIQNGAPVVRGSDAWDERELAREKSGSRLLSYGSIADSNATKGFSSKARLTSGNIKKARTKQLP